MTDPTSPRDSSPSSETPIGSVTEDPAETKAEILGSPSQDIDQKSAATLHEIVVSIRADYVPPETGGPVPDIQRTLNLLTSEWMKQVNQHPNVDGRENPEMKQLHTVMTELGRIGPVQNLESLELELFRIFSALAPTPTSTDVD